MTESEIARLEEELHLQVPAAYLAIVRQLDQELEGLYGSLGKGVNRPLMWLGADVLETNLLIRRQPTFYCTSPAAFAKSWPDRFLACGYERAGNIFYVIDTKSKDLPVQQILSKPKSLEPCTKYPTLDALREYALKCYREFSAKHVKSWGAKRGKPYQAAKLAKPKTSARTLAASAKPADARLTAALATALTEAGFKFQPPKRAHSVAAIIGDVLPDLPGELLALYNVCDGGACRRLGLRIVPLAEAARMARTFANWSPTMGYVPIVDSPQSDPCFVCTKGPLRGYVLFIHHDGPRVVLARSVREFLSILSKHRGGKRWNLEDAAIGTKAAIYAPFAFADEQRTLSDLKAARELIKIANRRIGKHDEGEHLYEVALMLLSTRKPADFLPLLKHRTQAVRELAQRRLGDTKSEQVAEAVSAANQELETFVKTAVKKLRQAGLDAQVVDRTSIRIDPYPIWLDVPVFFDRRKKPDVWDFLLERAKFFVSLEK